VDPARIHQITGRETNRDKDALRKREERSESARIFIPECVNPKRREACLQDPERFMRTYLPRKFRQPFAKVHRKLIAEIWDRATTGGRKAMAAPRSRGKSTIVKGMNVALVCAERVRFIVPICATTKLAGRLYRDFQYEIGHNDLLLEDFPEICWPVRALDGAPQRAPRQHIDGRKTNIYWSTTDFLRLAKVPGDANEYLKSLGNEWSPYGGVKMTFCGLDAAFRGLNIDDDRPDYLIIDDPETRESAKSEEQVKNRIETIERDVEGLEGQEKTIAMVMITTIQNNYSLSAQFTDKDIRPSWDGERFGWVVKWPAREDMWEEYVSLRRQGQVSGDRHGQKATDYYLANRSAMDEGVELLADTFKQTVTIDNTQLVFSAIQEVYNKISDTSRDSFFTEYQNDPPEAEKIDSIDLTAAHVAGCKSGYARGVKPDWVQYVTRGIDMGKTVCWWVDLGFSSDGTGCVIDYGKFETFGLTAKSSDDVIELAMINALTNFVGGNDINYEIDYALVDSGYKPESVYEGCRRIEDNYFPVKGPDGNYRQPKPDPERHKLFFECHCSIVRDRNNKDIWLFHPNTEYWKNWLQERFVLDPWTGQTRTRGSMAIYDSVSVKEHSQFSRSIVSERLEHQPLPHKGFKKVWNVIDRNNNHWLDAAGYACAAASMLGVTLIEAESVQIVEVKEPTTKPLTDPYGRPFVAMNRK
jgi:hypothetical protein